LVKGLELYGDEPEGVDKIIELMDSYFLTKEDWDAIYELGLGPQAVEKVTLSTANKTRFTRKYNQMSHPLPFMKASGQLGPVKKSKDKPDLEEAIEESDEEELLADVQDESEEELDLKKDKYVQAPKKKKAAPASKSKGKKAKSTKDDDDEDDSEEDVKPKKGRGRPAAKGKAKK
jgi:replication factor C subunit 1